MSLSNDENEENPDNNQIRESNHPFVLGRNINGDVRGYLPGQTQNQDSEDSAFSSDQTEVRGVENIIILVNAII